MRNACTVQIDCLELARLANYRAANLAQLLDVSLRQLERGFAECKTTPKEWVDSVRLWETALQIENGAQPKNLPGEFGFESESNFFHKFRDHHGCTPGEYCEIMLRRAPAPPEQLQEILQIGRSLAGLVEVLAPEDALAFLGTVPLHSAKLRKLLIRCHCRRQTGKVAPKQ